MIYAIAALLALASPSHGASFAVHRNAWQRMLRDFDEMGPNAPVYHPSDGYAPPVFLFERLQGRRGEPHKLEDFSLWGEESGGKFEPVEVKFESEDWRAFKPQDTTDAATRTVCLSKTCLFVDMWGFTLGLDGKKLAASHGWMVEDSGGIVYASGEFRDADSRGPAKLGSVLAGWQKYLDPLFTREQK